MIILLGKHQFTVSSIDDGGNTSDNNSTNSNVATSPTQRRASFLANSNSRKSLIDIIENAERIIADLDGDNRQKQDISAR